MSSTSTAPRLTYEDYRTIPDDGKRHEIIEGEEYMSPSPTTSHQRIVGCLFNSLYNHVSDHGGGEVFMAPHNVILSDHDVVQPDVFFVTAERREIVKERGIAGAPDLVVEVVSEGNRRHDEVRKRRVYARHGVTEYGVVDPELKTVKVYRRPEDGYERVAEWRAETDDTLTTPNLSGWALPLTTLFQDLRPR
ncbi:MAG: Uma2 family endonuclease [Salinibacter sp.]